jgi:acetyltransferase-like isoleucine patch superfamily enzyme
MNRVVSGLLNRLAFVCPGGFNVRPRIHRWRGAHIGRGVWIGAYVYIDELHPEALSIGENCTIGIRTSILTHFYWGSAKASANGQVVIEKDVFIGPHCVILPNVRIGEGSVINAGTVITRSVPAHSFVGSPPAGVLGRVTVPLTPEHGYMAFLRGLRPARSRRVPSSK